MTFIKFKWIIAICCFWINFFIFGVFRSAGVLYIQFTETFECTYQQASWPISLAGSMASITGIAAGFLSHYLSVRTLVFVGVLICSISTSICYFASTIWFIIISLGIVQGIGIGLVINLLPAIISQYFDQQRAVAVGFSFAGATTGALVFPYLIEWHSQLFGLKSTLLLMGGLTLHALIGAILLKPRKQNSAKVNRIRYDRKNIEDSTVYGISNENKFDGKPSISIEDVRPLRSECNESEISKFNSFSATEKKFISKASDNNSKIETNSELQEENHPLLLKSILTNFANDSKLLFDWYFELCALTYISFVINFMSFLIVMPDYALDNGLTQIQSTLLLSIFSIFDLFGRLIPGWISYFDILSNKSIYISTIAVMGISFILMPIFATNFPSIVAFTIACGFVSGCQMVLAPVVLSEHFGAGRTAVAFGLSNFMCGIVTIITKPFMFSLRDLTGNYVALFVSVGSLAMISALLWVIREIKVYCKNL